MSKAAKREAGPHRTGRHEKPSKPAGPHKTGRDTSSYDAREKSVDAQTRSNRPGILPKK